MTDLREELARAINKTRPPTCDHPQCSCTYDCERWDDMADSYLDAVDNMAPIIAREIARVRAEERERCARVADTVPIETYASPPYIAQAKQVRLTVAAAIRAMGDE